MEYLTKVMNDKFIPNDLILIFFVLFSRFEYTLKNNDYICSKNCKPDWFELGKEIDEYFDPSNCQQAYDYLINNPPKKQVCKKHNCSDSFIFDKWKDENISSSVEINKIITIIKRVRNNLFHGGKDINGTERDKNLIKYSIFLMEEILNILKEHRPTLHEDFITE